MTYVWTFVFFVVAYTLAVLALSGLMYVSGLGNNGPAPSKLLWSGLAMACVAWMLWWGVHGKE